MRLASLLLIGATFPTLSVGQAPLPCTRRSAMTGTGFELSSVELLAGAYTLILRDTTSRSTIIYDLVLWVNDSVRRYRYVTPHLGRELGERPLGGSARSRGRGTTDTAWSAPENGRWSVQFLKNRLNIGTIDALDGWRYMLDVGTITPHGFAGRWTSDWGFEVIVDRKTGKQQPNPAGYFCATVVPPFAGAPTPLPPIP